MNPFVVMARFSGMLLFVFAVFTAQAQADTIESKKVPITDGGKPGAIILKTIPTAKDPVKISGNGTPREKYVVQLARFISMDKGALEQSFPKGTFLWINPDYGQETMLLAGFYDSLEAAREAALAWRKKNKMFAEAFARSKPFLIMYE
ncbi:MAG: hypothetical protein NWR67_03045 [Saprospiraceae bacterium]|jgi:hypothetical protein|nr:hypothetical protein [Saprospiraceae bacterium]MDP4819953.1 hypothetical protein [Saprospiraceae bacterium]MDP4998507.1 hypothetical protein [Saprospiraceae bacterium]